jgi:hypothetical protein
MMRLSTSYHTSTAPHEGGGVYLETSLGQYAVNPTNSTFYHFMATLRRLKQRGKVAHMRGEAVK